MIKLISGAVIVFWALMTILYFKQEILPALPALTQPSYETFLKSTTILKNSQMGIYFGGRKIGSSITKTETLPDGYYRMSNTTTVSLFQGPFENKIELNGYSLINKNYQLDSFQFTVKSLIFNYEIKGKTEKEEMIVEIFDGKNTEVKRFKNLQEATLSNGFSPFLSMPNLSVGKEWTINMVNPMNGTIERVRAFVETQDTMEWKGKEYTVYEVVIDYKGYKPRGWITPEGYLLKEELILPGLYFIRE